MQTSADASRPLGGAYILIVDDEFLIASDVEFLFSDAGARVHLSATLADALAAARAEPFSAALLDIRLGIEFSEAVADTLLARGIPFLFFSGQSIPEHMRVKFPQARLLLKPMGFHELVGAVIELLRGRGAAVAAALRDAGASKRAPH